MRKRRGSEVDDRERRIGEGEASIGATSCTWGRPELMALGQASGDFVDMRRSEGLPGVLSRHV
eukprot:1357628-Amorphochlora_amoeboformis.AAC.1